MPNKTLSDDIVANQPVVLFFAKPKTIMSEKQVSIRESESLLRPFDAKLLPLTILLADANTSLQTIGGRQLLPFENATGSNRDSVLANAALLAFMHDLVAQSPLSTQTSQNREKLLYEHLHDLERRFREGKLQFDEQEVRSLQRTNGYLLYRNETLSDLAKPRAKPFNFVPSGTRELFLDWPSHRDSVKRYAVPGTDKVYEVCVPTSHTDWLAAKISMNRVPFDLDLYDPRTYFALPASILRLLRRSLQVQLFVDRDWTSAQLSQYMDASALADQCKPTYSPQDCLLSWLQTTYGNVPRGDTALHIAQQRLFATDNVSRVARWIVFLALERLQSGALSSADAIHDQAQEFEQAQAFVDVAARVYALLATVPPIDKHTAIEYRLLTSLESTESRLHFDRRLYADYTQWRKQDRPIDRRVFIAAEAMRWNLFFFSGWDRRAIDDVSFEQLTDALEDLYRCLPENRIVIDADLLRRFAAQNVDAMLSRLDDKERQQLPMDTTACRTAPTLHNYAKLLSKADKLAESVRRRQTRPTAMLSLTEKDADMHNNVEKEQKTTAETTNGSSDKAGTSAWLRDAHDLFDMREPLQIQRVLWTMRDTVLNAEDATPAEKREWLDALYAVYSSTYAKSLRQLTESWSELRNLLQLLLPAADVPVARWSQWQRTIRSLYNNSELPEATSQVAREIELPMPYMNEEQFVTGGP